MEEGEKKQKDYAKHGVPFQKEVGGNKVNPYIREFRFRKRSSLEGRRKSIGNKINRS